MAALDENGVQRLWENTVALVGSTSPNVYVTGEYDIANNAVVNLSYEGQSLTFEKLVEMYNRRETIKIRLHIPMDMFDMIVDYYLVGDLSSVIFMNGVLYGFVFKIMFKGDLGYGDFLYYNTLTIDASGNTTVETSIVNTLV